MIKKVKKIKCIKSIKKENKHIFLKRSIIRKPVPLTKNLLKNMNIKSCLNLIRELNKPSNFNIMANCFFNISRISRLFPPAKNENKFIYGKLIELELIKTFSKRMICDDLDSKHSVGSEYKNDCEINGNKYSIKASKNGDKITVINKLNKKDYDIDTSFIIIHIKNKKLYVFPTKIINKEFIVNNDSNISFKPAIFHYLDKYYKQFIYKFPDMNKDQYEEIMDTEPINVYNYLYEKFIK
jgi:hypothetical protein